MTPIRAIVTGATGMVGEGVLHECLIDPSVEKVLAVGRRSCGIVHEKLNEIIIAEFFKLSDVEEQLRGYNACFFCLGVSSLGMKKDEYYRITYELTLHFARTLAKLNPDMTFCYISGAGTDGTEKGRISWARVKGKTENDLMKLPFKDVYVFRPAFMFPTKGLKNTLPFYRYITWLYPLMRKISPGSFGTLADFGKAMIRSVLTGYPEKVVTGEMINRP